MELFVTVTTAQLFPSAKDVVFIKTKYDYF